VGNEWPAGLATWLMIRLKGPRLLEEQLARSQLSTYLALGGVALSLLLTWNLGRTLQMQRREQERLRDELRHAEHLAALGKLLAGVAHEVRNPLAAIRSTVQLWQRMADSARTPESLDAVVQSVDRFNAIVTRLLVFSRADNAERRPLELNSLLAETMDLVQAQAAEQAVQLNRAFAANLPTVRGSSSALRQVILNLLANALQAMPQGGTLTCSTAYRAAERRVEMVFTDTGAGVSAENRSHLFEPFFTTRLDGTGLAICREIVNKHGGAIEYLEPENCGATFRILLPTGV
jgi:two-component system sensor histidine kinase HydH